LLHSYSFFSSKFRNFTQRPCSIHIFQCATLQLLSPVESIVFFPFQIQNFHRTALQHASIHSIHRASLQAIESATRSPERYSNAEFSKLTQAHRVDCCVHPM